MCILFGEQLAALLLKDYIEDYSFEVGLKNETVRGKRDTLKRFLYWLGDRQFTANTCKAWIMSLKTKGLMPNSIKHEARILRAAVRFLYKKKYIKQDFALEIPSPKVPKRPLELVPVELAEQIIINGTESGPGDNCINRQRKQEYRVALKFILRTGLRNRKTRSLRGSDINLEDETYLVRSKSGNLDRLPLPKDMIKEIGQRANNGQLFPDLRAERLNICLTRGSRRLGVKTRVRVHTLRHIFCTTLLKKGVPLQIVSRLMRHASVAITDSVYSHYLIDDLKQSLNERHPLIRQGLTPGEVMKSIQLAVESTGIRTDTRFQTDIENSANSLVIKIGLI
ncbi:MAG: tyrosine-type recombinase/integrase [Armatimonadota bacterium]